MAKIEVMMEEALQDIPPLVHDIQERLKGISESVAVDGKPRSGLPNKRHLWDRLKPQASSVSTSQETNYTLTLLLSIHLHLLFMMHLLVHTA